MTAVGSDLNRTLRWEAARTEPQWTGAGATPGTTVWLVERSRVRPWPAAQHGTFRAGDSYVILHTHRRNAATVVHDVYVWIGDGSARSGRGTAAYRMAELDDALGGRARHHMEVQGFESDKFRSYFPAGLSYPAGGGGGSEGAVVAVASADEKDESWPASIFQWIHRLCSDTDSTQE